MDGFKLHAPYAPAGDQPKAIRALTEGFQNIPVGKAEMLQTGGEVALRLLFLAGKL